MLRIIVENCDAGMAANVGGSVHTSWKTFDVDLPELEAYLQEPVTQKWTYTHRQVTGVEVKP